MEGEEGEKERRDREEDEPRFLLSSRTPSKSSRARFIRREMKDIVSKLGRMGVMRLGKRGFERLLSQVET